MRAAKTVMLMALLAAVPAVAPAQPASIRATMYGGWALACPRAGGRDATPSCTIRYQSPGSRPGFGVGWDVFLGEGGSSRFATSGWSRTTCQRIAVNQDAGRLYRLTDATIPLWRMEDHARRLLAAMRSHIPSFGDCPRQGADSEAYLETSLDGQEADFTRALIAAETRLRGRGPDPNEGRTTPANLAWLEIDGPRESLDRLAAVAVERGWSVESRTARHMFLTPPPNYRPSHFEALTQQMDRLGLRDIEVRLIGHYGPTRVDR